MAVTEQSYTGNGSTTNYSFTFPYLKSTDIEVQVDAVVTTAWSLANATTVQFNTAPANGAAIKILRDTNVDNLTATFYAGSAIKSEDLNDNFTQNLYVTQEIGNRSFENTGTSTMIGNLNMGEDTTIVFEGATNNDYETTLTVTDPTADRTITIPNVTGTVVTTGDSGTVATGMIAADAINGTKIADDAIDSEHLAADSIDAEHYAAGSVDTTALGADAVTGAKIADDAIDSEHYTDGSIDHAHLAADCVDGDNIADNSINSEHYVDGSIDHEHLSADCVTGDEIADNSINSEHYADGSIDRVHLGADIVDGSKIADDQINSEHIAAGAVDLEHMSANSVDSAQYVDGSIDHEHLSADCVTGDEIADNSINSEHYADGSIDHVHLGADIVDGDNIADDSIGAEHIKANAVGTSEIADGELTTLAGMQAGTASILAGGTALAATLTEINTVCDGKGVQTTISDSDAHYPTSGAVVDYVAAQIAPIGGLEVIADEDNFPTSIPASGVVISIADAAGVVVQDGSGGTTAGRSTTARTAGNGSDNVTINNFPSSLHGETLATGNGLMVTSTGSSNTYNYHKLLASESDVKQLSDDINDFNSRYRINAGEPSSNNDDGDLVWDTSADKMKVYDATASAWKEVTSSGDFKYLFLCPAGGSGAPTLNGSIATYDLREASNSGSAASVTSAAQLLVSINGVVQKANTGTSAPAEGFALVDSNTIIFGANLASGDSVFIVQFGSALTITTPGDNTVSSAKIQNGAVVNAKITDDTISEAKLDIHNAPSGTDKFLKYTSNGLEWVVPSYTTNTNTNVLAGGTITGDVIFDNATNAGNDLTWDMSDNALEFDDSVKATFGDDADLQIYHNGTDGFIDNNTRHLYIRCNVDDDDGGNIYIQAKSGEQGIKINDDGAVELYYDNTNELETKSGGVKLNGHSEQAVNALGNTTGSTTIDFSVANIITATLTGNTTFANPTTESVGQSGSIIVTQDGTGSRTLAWGSQFKWAGGTAPTLTTTASAVDRIDYLVVAADTIHCVASLAMA